MLATGRRVVTASAVAWALAAILLLSHCSRDHKQDKASTPDLERRLDQLRSVPYTSFTEEPVDREASGVRIYVQDRVYPGYNFYARLDSLQAYLIDMDGRLVHTWAYPQQEGSMVENAIMLDNGDAIIIEKYRNLIRLDWNSNLIWKKPMHVHHEVTPLGDGTFYVILREVKTYRGLKVRFPAIAHISAAGEELDRWSSYDHLDEIKEVFDQRSFFDTILDGLLAKKDSAEIYKGLARHPDVAKLKTGTKFYDYFQMNTITIIPDTPLGRRDSRFAAGNLLICFRNVNQIAVLDKDTKKPLWAWGEGILQWPHHPTVMANGNFLIFDNGVERNYSTVLEINPVTEAVEWKYQADPPHAFFSYSRGSAQRLPNGNTLICEADRGRTFEVTRQGEIVWEWFNPQMQQDRRAQIHRMVRIDPEVVEPLLEKKRP